jgi:hypothetical protein
LLREKAKRLRKETGDDRWYAPIERMDKSVLSTVGHAMTRPFKLLAFEYMCACLDVYSAFLLGVLYLFFGAFPLVFTGNHGFNLWELGFSFSGLFVGIVSAGASFPVWHKVRLRLMRRRARVTGENGVSEPEYRLPSVMVGSVFVPVGLFWFGWTTYASVHWIVPIIGSGFFAFG